MQRDISPSHRVDQSVDCGLWNVVPLLFNGCATLLDISGNWNYLSYRSIQSIPNVLNGWYVWCVCRPLTNWDIFSFQDLCTDPCDIIMHGLQCILQCRETIKENPGRSRWVQTFDWYCTLEAAYSREMNVQFSGNNSGGHSCSQHANCTLPCVVWQNCTF